MAKPTKRVPRETDEARPPPNMPVVVPGHYADGDSQPLPERKLPSIKLEQAAAELLRRQRARDSLVEYARAIDIPGAPANADPENEVFNPVESDMALHHRFILRNIQETIETSNGRLMIFAPPGSAKSSYASVVTPSWCMAKYPGYRLILASYALDLAEKHSRKARALCRQERHISIWKDRPQLSADQRSIQQWALSNGSEFMAAGMMSGITGNRANGIMIDDPVKGREAADSETIRNKIKDEYQDSVDSRLLPGGWIILIQTRWHQDDLAGGILPEDYAGQSGKILCRDGQVWTVINLPAEAEHDDDPIGRAKGEFLWPEWVPESHWLLRKNNPQGQRTWAALFQQRPTAGEGIEFKREWFNWYDPDLLPGQPGGPPKSIANYGASDFATKDDRTADFTEHGIVGITSDFAMVFKDWWFGQKTSDVYIAAFVGLVRRWRPRKWWDEGNVIGHAIAPARTRALRDAKPAPLHVTCEQLTSIKSKALKLASFQSHAAQGRVYLPLKRPWAVRLVDQLCAFPAGKYDDAADVCGLIGRGLDQMMGLAEVSPDPKPTIKPFSAKWLEYNEQQEHTLRFS